MFKPWQSREPIQGHCCTGHCPRTMPHSNCHITQLTPPIEVFLSILESACHKLCIAHGLTLVTPSLCGWEAFPMPKARTHTRITWALSTTAPQVMGVTLGCPRCFGHSSWRGAQQGFHCTTIVIQNSSSSIILHHLHKAHIECHGCPSASLLHPKLSQLHSRSSSCPPTREPNQFSSSPRFWRSMTVSFYPLPPS